MTPYEHFESVYNLKSNMDRFIADKLKDERIMSANLKSNMDRFIVVNDC